MAATSLKPNCSPSAVNTLMSPWQVCDDGLELRMRIVAVVAVIAAASTACYESSTPTTPTTRALVDARVVDSKNFKLGVPIPVPTVKGTLAGNFDASIWDGSRWVSLGSPNGITVPLQIYYASATPVTVHGEQSAPAGSYDRVRLVMQGVTATIERGSSFGGTTFSSDPTFRLGGSDHHVELPVTVSRFSLEESPSVKRVIVFELSSERWLTSSVAQSGQVEDAALQAAISARTSLEPR